MKIIVTGGAGFIGSAVIRQYINDTEHDVVNLDALTYAGNLENLKDLDQNPNYTFIKGDIVEDDFIQKIFEEHQFDAVIHLAAESHVDRSIVAPDAFIRTNIEGTFNLLEVSRQNVDRLVLFHHVSTDEVYGSLGSDGLFTEKTPYKPNSPYSASKAASDHLVRACHRTYDLPVTISNCSNNYGPYQFPEKLIPLMIINLIESKPLPVYGDGLQRRDWLHVRDHCRAIITMLDAPRPEYEVEWSVNDVTRGGRVDWFWALETDRADCPFPHTSRRLDERRRSDPRS